MECEYVIGAEYCMSKLVDKALGQRIKPPSFDLDAETLGSSDLVDKPSPIVKQANAQHHAQLLATFLFFMDNHKNLVMHT